MNKRFLLAIILVNFLFFGCARKPMLFTSDTVMEDFDPHYLNFSYLSARGRVVLEEQNGKITKGTLNIRAKKDSVIWFNMSPGLGIEAVRGLVTTDHIKIRDRINHQTIDMSYTEFSNKYGVPLSFSVFQNLLFANIPQEFSLRDRLIRVGRTFELSQERDNIMYKSVVSASHGKVTQLESEALRERSGSLSANYMEFKDVESQPFPYKALIKMVLSLPQKPKTQFSLNAEMVKVELTDEPLSFPYNF